MAIDDESRDLANSILSAYESRGRGPSPNSTSTVLGDLRLKGRAWKIIRSDKQKLHHYMKTSTILWDHMGWQQSTRIMAVAENEFAANWIDAGAVVYELSHDMAALFSLTTAPPFDWSIAPHQYFVVKVPRAFLPLNGSVESSDSWLFVSPGGVLVVPDYDTTADLHIGFSANRLDDPESTLDKSPWIGGKETQEQRKTARLVTRYVTNLICYLASSSPVRPVSFLTKKSRSVFVIKPPSDVVITREFRDAARAVVSSNSFAGVRRALAHVVRGHWRNQPCGKGRQEIKRTWVRPHRRGDESLGRVVQRIERISNDNRTNASELPAQMAEGAKG